MRENKIKSEQGFKIQVRTCKYCDKNFRVKVPLGVHSDAKVCANCWLTKVPRGKYKTRNSKRWIKDDRTK